MSGKVALLGGGGFVGRCIASRLSGRGFNVTVPTRRRDNRKELAMLPGVRLVAANIHDPLDLEDLFGRAAAVTTLVGILPVSDSSPSLIPSFILSFSSVENSSFNVHKIMCFTITAAPLYLLV